ncbi:MAG: polymer-forming cytoskeletal protein [Bdellovibrionota bacterium]
MEADSLNIITAGTKLDGTVEFKDYTRFEGFISGTLRGLPGSEVVIGEQGVIEGSVEGDILIIDGFVRGTITATTKVIISETGRVIGEIHSPNIAIKFGGYFDGSCAMDSLKDTSAEPLADTSS